MTDLPCRGDIAIFVMSGQTTMIGIVEGDGHGGDSFGEGTEHQIHPCNRGAVRLHAEPTQRTWVNILQFMSINLGIIGHAWRGQQTWMKVTE